MIEYIFSASTGRAGSLYLSELFATIKNCVSVHEPAPQMNGEFMKAVLTGGRDTAYIRKGMERKVAQISQTKGRSSLYVETTHLFVKSFGWYIVDYIPEQKIGLVILDRERKAIVDSLYRVDCLPTNRLGQKWLCTPLNCEPLIPFPATNARAKALAFMISKRAGLSIRSADDFDRKFLEWYVDEIGARTEYFVKQHPRITVFRTSAKRLNEKAEFCRLVEHFGVQAPDELMLSEKIGTAINSKSWHRGSRALSS